MSRRERHKRRRHNRGHPAVRGITVTALVILAVAGLGVAGVVGWVVSVAESAPSLNKLKPLDKGANSLVYTHDGKRLGFIPAENLRTPVPDGRIPRVVKRATVATEDRRFYKHAGIDYEGVIRAAVKNISNKKTVQGGSTLTMQLVRNIYLPNERSTKSFTRKIREAKLAQELEQRHPGLGGKRWILDKYLNSVDYGTVGGQSAIGIEAASRMFYDKPARKLTLPQAALLAGLPQAPSEYNPFLSPSSAYARRAEVLDAMVTAGQITPAEAAEARKTKLGVKHNRYYTARREQFFFDFVKDELFKHYGAKAVQQGGLRIYTTVDFKLQDEARKAIAGRLNEPSDPSSAIVTIDPRNGHILAMASSQSYGKTTFNYATQAHRQPGSTFKVMVLMTALARGVDPNSTTYNSHLLAPGWLPGYPDYKVETYGHDYGGQMNLVQATLRSDNTVYAQLGADLGPEAVRETAYKLGIKTHLDAYPAEALGGLTYGVSPLEMANAIATVASGGWRNKPVAVLKVIHPSGRVDNLGKGKRVKAFSDGVTAEATKVLHQNVLSGTGVAANYGCPAAGKTGTTSDYKDAWFVGFTPRLATSVWVGYPNPPIPMRSVHGITVAGATFPAEIWHDFMNVAHGSYCGDFAPPKEAFSSAPFFGKYSRTGTRHDYNYDGSPNNQGSTNPNGGNGGAPPTQTQTQTQTTPQTTKPFDPNAYETPPQAPPATVPPATSPPAGNGGQGGGGQGQNGGGQGGGGTTP
jgi:penicillin-binding protein 1A